MKESDKIFDVGDIVRHKSGIKHKIVGVSYVDLNLNITSMNTGRNLEIISYHIVPNILNSNDAFFHQGSIYCGDCKLDIKEMRKLKLKKLHIH